MLLSTSTATPSPQHIPCDGCDLLQLGPSSRSGEPGICCAIADRSCQLCSGEVVGRCAYRFGRGRRRVTGPVQLALRTPSSDASCSRSSIYHVARSPHAIFVLLPKSTFRERWLNLWGLNEVPHVESADGSIRSADVTAPLCYGVVCTNAQLLPDRITAPIITSRRRLLPL